MNRPWARVRLQRLLPLLVVALLVGSSVWGLAGTPWPVPGPLLDVWAAHAESPRPPQPVQATAEDEATDTDTDTDGEPGTAPSLLLPPVGVVAEAEHSAIHLAWLPAPGSDMPAEAFDVLWWPETDAGFALRQRLAREPQPARHARIAGLQPNTVYYVTVRSATQTLLPELERRGDWSLSRMSRPLRVRTRRNPDVRLLAASERRTVRAVFALRYTHPETGQVHDLRAVAHVGEPIVGWLAQDGRTQEIATGYRLARVFRRDHRPFATAAADGPAAVWHELTRANGEPPRDELDGDPLELRLPRRVEPVPPIARMRAAVTLQHITSGEECVLVAE